MCTVTYLPKPNGDYILTSSRDEKTTRGPALLPQEYRHFEKKIIYPKDPLAGGTWIAHAEGRTICLLNGAFEKHIPQPPYAKSRGLVVLDYFSYPSLIEFINHYSFTNIEPFTLIVVEKKHLYEFRWDGRSSHFFEHAIDLPKIWSSSTLYNKEVRTKRELWFSTWWATNVLVDIDSIRTFHTTAGEGDKDNDLVINRNEFMKTVSITTIEKSGTEIHVKCKDLILSESNSLSFVDLETL